MNLTPYRGPTGTQVEVSAVRRLMSGSYECETNVAPAELGPVLEAAASTAGWRDTRINGKVQQFTASRTMRLKYNLGSRSHELMVRWVLRHGATTINWTVEDTASQYRRVPDQDAMERFGDALVSALHQYGRVRITTPVTPHNPIIAPGEFWPGGRYTGDLYDYSRLAHPGQLEDLRSGILSLGSYAFPGMPAPQLYVPESPGRQSRELLRNRGILLCAPTRAGKTSLMLRWAENVIAAGFSTVILDPKGGLYPKLRQRLADRNIDAELYHFATDQHDRTSDVISFLGGLGRITVADDADEDGDGDGERLRQIVAALLPRLKTEDEQSFRRNLHRDWALAMLVILKLAEHHFPDDFTIDTDKGPVRRSTDLADFYLLAANEDKLLDHIKAIREREGEIARHKQRLQVESVEESVLVLVGALDPAKLPGEGKRRQTDSYESYMQPLRLALSPFRRGGLLHNRVIERANRRNFRFDMLGRRNRPVTLVLAAREHDEEPAEAVLRLVTTRLRHMVLDRISGIKSQAAERPGELMLFLDETARIEAFDPAKYFSMAAQGGVTAVVVYQSLEDIGKDTVRRSVMRNVGLQVYLGNVRDSDETILNAYLGERRTTTSSHTLTYSDTGSSITDTYQQMPGAFFPTPTLHRFPTGRYPALVVLNDEQHAPFIVDLFDPTLA